MEVRQIQYLPPKSLRRHPRNAHVHPKKQIEQLARSIRAFGFTNPILINQRKEVLAGHARLEAAMAAGVELVPTILLDGLSAAEERAYLLADNKLAEKSGWDDASLAVELRELSALLADAGLDLEITGFETAEIDSLLSDFVDPEGDPGEEIPPICGEAVSRRGDLWHLGDNRLICGDAREDPDLRALMGRDRADMAFADPPYNVKLRATLGRGKIKHREFAAASGEMSSRQYTRFLASALAPAAKYSVDGAIHFVCMDWRHLREMLDAGEEVYSELKNIVVWVKTNIGQGNFYRSQHELIFVWKNGHSKRPPPIPPVPDKRSLKPGTILAREHDRELHRVMVLDNGFAWNGATYRSLSEVARAITGTNWNGPRFFGLRDKPAREGGS